MTGQIGRWRGDGVVDADGASDGTELNRRMASVARAKTREDGPMTTPEMIGMPIDGWQHRPGLSEAGPGGPPPVFFRNRL